MQVGQTCEMASAVNLRYIAGIFDANTIMMINTTSICLNILKTLRTTELKQFHHFALLWHLTLEMSLRCSGFAAILELPEVSRRRYWR